MIQWDDPHIIPANMTVEVSELFTRELTRVTKIFLSFMVTFVISDRRNGFVSILLIFQYMTICLWLCYTFHLLNASAI